MQLQSILNYLKQGILICDRACKVLYCNEEYGKFIEIDPKDLIGKNITELREGSLIPEVIRTGGPIENVHRKEKDHEYFASIFPVIEEGIVLGSISIVTTMDQSKKHLENESKPLDERVREFEREEINRYLSIYGKDLKGKKRTAKELGISLATLYNKINEK